MSLRCASKLPSSFAYMQSSHCFSACSSGMQLSTARTSYAVTAVYLQFCETQSAVQASEVAQTALASQAALSGLRIHLGPELRAVYPVVVNLGLSGDVTLSGPLDPERLSASGTINLDGGEVRLKLHSFCAPPPSAVAAFTSLQHAAHEHALPVRGQVSQGVVH